MDPFESAVHVRPPPPPAPPRSTAEPTFTIEKIELLVFPLFLSAVAFALLAFVPSLHFLGCERHGKIVQQCYCMSAGARRKGGQ